MRFCRAACFGRQEAFEEETVGRQAGDIQRRQHRRGAGDRRHRVARVLRRAHQLVAGIGNQRRAGVGDQRDRLAAPPAAPEIFGRASAALCS